MYSSWKQTNWGKAVVEIETQGQRLLIDLGLPLDAEKNNIQYFA